MIELARKIASAAALTALAMATPVSADGILEDPLPRFEDRLCPGVVGLDEEYAELMVSRFRMNAESFGLRLASEGECEPNVVIAFVDDSRAYLEDLLDRRAYLFRDMGEAGRAEMLEEAGASGVWHQVAAHTRDGLRVGRSDNLVQVPETGMWQAHSRIYRPVRQDITYSLVLLSRENVTGLTLRQLADYATLRALATEYPDEAGTEQSSMLTLFTSDDRPDELTAFDRAWLERLYEGIPNALPSSRLRGVEVAEND